MANRSTVPAKEVVGTTDAFVDFTRRILSVPHSAIKAKLDAEKAEKRTSKTSASRDSHASSKQANR
jgi:hypothetical protein